MTLEELAQRFFAAEDSWIVADGVPWIVRSTVKAILDLQLEVGELKEAVAKLQTWNAEFRRLNQ